MKDKKLLLSIITSIIIFIIGFGAMNIFYIVMPKYEGLRGLYDYKAATIGDGICLPILIAALIYFTETKDILSKRHNILCGVVGIMTALLGSAIQISWLQNDNIITNWTIPYKHYFNAAGWYHTFFFIFMFGILGALLFKFFLTRTISASSKYKINNAEKVDYFLIWFSGCWFLLLHIIDDYQEKYNITLLLQLTSLALLIIIIFLNAVTAKTIIYRRNCLCIFGCPVSFGNKYSRKR